MRKTAFAVLGTFAAASMLLITGCADDEDDSDCDGMGTQMTDTVANAAAAQPANFVELPNAATLPGFAPAHFALQADTKADGTVTLADDCGNDDEDD